MQGSGARKGRRERSAQSAVDVARVCRQEVGDEGKEVAVELLRQPDNLRGCRNLYLLSNRFSGPIPDSILSLHSLVRLDLSYNCFSGPIPSSLCNLSRLRSLLLQGNSLSGPIPPNLASSPLDHFNVSGNSLNGSIPQGLAKFGESAFAGNDLCGKPLTVVCS